MHIDAVKCAPFNDLHFPFSSGLSVEQLKTTISIYVMYLFSGWKETVISNLFLLLTQSSVFLNLDYSDKFEENVWSFGEYSVL